MGLHTTIIRLGALTTIPWSAMRHCKKFIWSPSTLTVIGQYVVKCRRRRTRWYSAFFVLFALYGLGNVVWNGLRFYEIV
jgi:hypothetical protein